VSALRDRAPTALSVWAGPSEELAILPRVPAASYPDHMRELKLSHCQEEPVIYLPSGGIYLHRDEEEDPPPNAPQPAPK
jgi:hypothetical protein